MTKKAYHTEVRSSLVNLPVSRTGIGSATKRWAPMILRFPAVGSLNENGVVPSAGRIRLGTVRRARSVGTDAQIAPPVCGLWEHSITGGTWSRIPRQSRFSNPLVESSNGANGFAFALHALGGLPDSGLGSLLGLLAGKGFFRPDLAEIPRVRVRMRFRPGEPLRHRSKGKSP